jgi:hypothetical protein
MPLGAKEKQLFIWLQRWGKLSLFVCCVNFMQTFQPWRKTAQLPYFIVPVSVVPLMMLFA